MIGEEECREKLDSVFPVPGGSPNKPQSRYDTVVKNSNDPWHELSFERTV